MAAATSTYSNLKRQSARNLRILPYISKLAYKHAVSQALTLQAPYSRKVEDMPDHVLESAFIWWLLADMASSINYELKEIKSHHDMLDNLEMETLQLQENSITYFKSLISINAGNKEPGMESFTRQRWPVYSHMVYNKFGSRAISYDNCHRNLQLELERFIANLQEYLTPKKNYAYREAHLAAFERLMMQLIPEIPSVIQREAEDYRKSVQLEATRKTLLEKAYAAGYIL